MTDYLIVHDVGQGAWFWNKVWGSVTAPEEHPPRLYMPRYANQFYLLNLPGHGSDAAGDTGEVRLDECIQAVTRAVERRGMHDLVLVGHGVGGLIAALAALELPEPPQHLALVAGVIPGRNRNALAQFPVVIRRRVSSRLSFSKLSGKDVRLSKSVISKYLCNGMAPNEITQALGFFGPLPTRTMETRVDLPVGDLPCPVTYLVLEQDRLLPRTAQMTMARRIPNVELASLHGCHQAALQKPAELGALLMKIGR